MVKLKCQRCGREWEYTGDKKFYTSCPDCKTSVKINEMKGGIRQDDTSRI